MDAGIPAAPLAPQREIPIALVVLQAAAVALLMSWPPDSAAAEVQVEVDASLAERTLSLVCAGGDFDEAAVRSSPLVQAQIEHNSGLRAAATMDAYVAALRAASACAAPDPDPFAVGRVIAAPDRFRRKVDAVAARDAELSESVARRLGPYLPADYTFSGSVVLAVPYFSCGGFSAAGQFFIDIACLSDDVESDWDGLALLVAHEIFHVIQEELFWPAPDWKARIATRADAFAFLYAELLLEGSAELVAPTASLPASGGGPYARLSRSFYDANSRRMPQNFALMSALLDRVAAARSDYEAATRVADSVLFAGEYEQIGYYVGERMLADIDRAWGRGALTCIMRLPPEQLVLAHDAVASTVQASRGGDSASDMLRLDAEAVGEARELARRRDRHRRYQDCVGDRALESASTLHRR
jgi:hypothetical protein